MDESGTDEAEFRMKVVSRRMVGGAIKSLVNARSLQLEYATVLSSCLFLCMVVRQGYGRRRRDLELGQYRCTTSEDCWGSGEWMKFRMHG